jgi:hypothetical protein
VRVVLSINCSSEEKMLLDACCAVSIQRPGLARSGPVRLSSLVVKHCTVTYVKPFELCAIYSSVIFQSFAVLYCITELP